MAGQSADVSCSAGTYAHTFDGVAGGEQTLTATMTYDGAEVSTRSTTFVVDVVAPAAPVVTSPTAGTTITTRQVTLAGTAEPGSTVYVFEGDGDQYASTPVGADGTFTVVLGEGYLLGAGVLTGKRGTLSVPCSPRTSSATGRQPRRTHSPPGSGERRRHGQRLTAYLVCTAYGEWWTSRISRSRSRVNPSHNRFPDPSTTGAVEDGQLVDQPGLQGLPGHAGPAADRDVLVAGGRARASSTPSKNRKPEFSSGPGRSSGPVT